jgi:cardiolipin synthase
VTIEYPHWIAHAVFLADIAIRLGISLRVIHRRLPVGVSLAWLAVILIFPFAGAGLYLLLGEYRLGRRRVKHAAAYRETCHARISKVEEPHRLDPARLGPERVAVARLAESALDAPVLANNRLELLENAGVAFPKLIADIDRAQRTCFLEFYIWSAGGRADEVAAALIRAVKRAVECRVLVDAIGSKAFLKSRQARDLRENGVRLVAALPAGWLSFLFIRPDLRLHRKIAVIDGTVGYPAALIWRTRACSNRTRA